MAAKSIGTLKAALILETNQFMGGFARAQKAVGGFATSAVAKLGAALQSGVVGPMVAAGTAALTAATSIHSLFESLGHVSALYGTSKRLGITVEATQRLAIAAHHSGIELDTLSNGLLLMGKNIGSGGKALDQRFLDVADAFTKIKDAGERAAFARAVFGKGGFEFINLLAKGSEGIKRSADIIDRFGLAISNLDAAKAKEATLAVKELKEVLGGLKDKVVADWAPAISKSLNDWLSQLELIIKGYRTITGFIPQLVKENANPVNTSFGGLMSGGLLNPGELGRRAAMMTIRAVREPKIPGKPGSPTELEKAMGVNGNQGGGVGKLSFATAAERGSVEAQRLITQSSGQSEARKNAPRIEVDSSEHREEHSAREEKGKRCQSESLGTLRERQIDGTRGSSETDWRRARRRRAGARA
jgi:hypothetical protein